MAASRLLSRLTLACAVLIFPSRLLAAPADVFLHASAAPAADPYPAAQVSAGQGFTPLAAGQASAGDLLLANNRVRLVLRPAAARAEFYAPGVAEPAIVFLPAAAKPRVVEQGPTITRIAVGGLEISMQMDDPTIRLSAADSPASITLEQSSALMVFPDPLADDIVLRSSSTTSHLYVSPVTHHYLQPTGDGAALLMVSWADPAPAITIDNQPDGFIRHNVGLPAGGAMHLSILAAPQTWRELPVDKLTFAKDSEQDWQVPFPAFWRATTLVDRPEWGGHLAESWWAVVRHEGSFQRPQRADMNAGTVMKNDERLVWSSNRGNYTYPFYVDGPRAFLRAPRYGQQDMNAKWLEPFVVYPIERCPATPDGTLTAWDILRRNVGGEKAFARLLNIDKVIAGDPRDIYPATCSSTEFAHKSIEDGKSAAEIAAIRKRLDEMDGFVRANRERIEEYNAWAKRVTDDLRTRRASAADKAAIDDLIHTADGIARLFEKKRAQIQTPQASEALSARLRAVAADPALTPEQRTAASDKIGRQIRLIGGGQDSLLGRYRMIARNLRQQALRRHLSAELPADRAVAAQVGAHSQEILRDRFDYEER